MPPFCFDFSKFSGADPPPPQRTSRLRRSCPTETPLLLPPNILYKLPAYTSFLAAPLALLALCAGNSSVTGEFTTQRPVTRRFGAFFDLCLNKRQTVNNRDACDLGRHRAHYDVTVMQSYSISGELEAHYYPVSKLIGLWQMRQWF